MKMMFGGIMLVSLLCSCNQIENKETIDELFIFGSSGFYLKDSTNKLYTFSEVISTDKNISKLVYDSSRLDIRQYFEFKKDSSLKLAIRRHDETTKYFTIAPTDTIGLNNLINSTLINHEFKSEYKFIKGTRLYDGWDYTLYYKTSKNKEYKINYVPQELPISLRQLHDYIERIIETPNLNLTPRFQYNRITTDEALSQFKNNPPLKLKNSIKFIPPKIKSDSELNNDKE